MKSPAERYSSRSGATLVSASVVGNLPHRIVNRRRGRTWDPAIREASQVQNWNKFGKRNEIKPLNPLPIENKRGTNLQGYRIVGPSLTTKG
jgi:hypothetical protein